MRFFASPDWLLKLGIPSVIHLPTFFWKKGLFGAFYPLFLVYTKTIIHLSVGVVDIYLAASRLGKYPPLFTSTLVNNC